MIKASNGEDIICLFSVVNLEMELLAEKNCINSAYSNTVTDNQNKVGSWSALLGGAIGWVLGRSYYSVLSTPSGTRFDHEYKDDEKDFIAQFWRYESELRHVRNNEQWDRLFLLVMIAAESFKEGWSEFIPGNPGYSPSPKFDMEIKEILIPFLRLCLEVVSLDFENLISPEKLAELDKANVNLNYATMKLIVNGSHY